MEKQNKTKQHYKWYKKVQLRYHNITLYNYCKYSIILKCKSSFNETLKLSIYTPALNIENNFFEYFF